MSNSPQDLLSLGDGKRFTPEKSVSCERSLPGNGKPVRRSNSRSRSRSRSGSFARRKRSYSRSRSRSRGRKHRYGKSRSRSHSPKHRSRSRSRSYSPRRSYSPKRHYDDRGYGGGGGGGSRYGGRSHYGGGGGGGGGGRYDRSPMSSRRRHVGNRDNPEPSRCLGVFGLSLYTQERELREVFGKYGPIEEVQVVYDAQSGRSRGFAFVYFEETDDAKMAKDRSNGQEIDGRKIRVDFSITKRAHTPTPGIYMGKPSYPRFGGRGGDDKEYYHDRHSPSPYYSRRRYSRSRSRSYSPRKYGYY